MKRLAVLAAFSALAAPAALAAGSPLEERLAVVASEVAGKPAAVRCYSEPEWIVRVTGIGWNPAETFGIVNRGSNLIELSPVVCGPLEAYVAAPPTAACQSTTSRTVTRHVWKWRKIRGKRKRVRIAVKVKVTEHKEIPCDPPPAVMYAVTTLAHEAQHVAGIVDEPTSECYGLQASAMVAERLGASAANARRLAEIAYFGYELIHRPGYYTEECRQGGSLDRSPADGRFP